LSEGRSLPFVPAHREVLSRKTFGSGAAEILGTFGTALLRTLPAEVAHDFGLKLLRSGLLERLPQPSGVPVPSGCRTLLPGIGELAHPIGLAAGFDKNATALPGFARLGFSFLEVGTVTPRAQPGNPKPRMFRLSGQRGLVNRMGFNNDGALTVSRRLRALGWPFARMPLGVNVGKNKDTPLERAVTDYMQGIETFRDLASYFVVNISSPNTPGLRELAKPVFIDELGDAIARDVHRTWIKLDPDMERADFERLIAAISQRGFAGIILTNTHRVERPEAGGQSGHPLLVRSTAMLEWAWRVHEGRLPMIGCGGVLSGADVLGKITRGASAVQIYTALVYRGPWAVVRILGEFIEELQLAGFATVQDALGSHYR